MKSFHFNLPDGVKVEDVVRRVIGGCLHCQRRPQIIRRPRDSTMRADRPRKILMMDYLYINSSGYILVLMDACTRKCLLKYSRSANVVAVIQALLEWRAHFGLLKTFTIHSDRGSHFCNVLFRELGQLLRFTHVFAISYCPWTNGGIESANPRILKSIKSLVSEYQLNMDEWKDVVPVVNHYMNNTPTRRNKGLTPNEVFMGDGVHEETLLTPNWVLFLESEREHRTPIDVEEMKKSAEILKEEINLRSEEVYEFSSILREKKNKSWSKTARVVQFNLNDWVLLSRYGTHSMRLKEKLTWTGPYRIVETISPNVYQIGSVDVKRITTHAARLWFYEPDGFIPSKEVIQQFHTDVGVLEVEKILKFRVHRGKAQLLVRWLGFTSEDDSWEPFETIAEDLPKLVAQFVLTLEARQRN